MDIANDNRVFQPEGQPVVDKNSFNESGRPLIKVIGVGGGGNNAVNHMYAQNIEGVSFVVMNTDRQALNNSSVPDKLLLGPTVTRGLGAGDVPEKACKAAEESADDIANLFDEDTKMVFITAGMGGGTGTGASPVVARIAKEKEKLTVGIVTIPFMFEGEEKILKALEGTKEMSNYVDAMLIINNERLTEIYDDLDLDNAFDKADDTLTIAARSIAEMITYHGKTNLDFEDVNTTLREGKTAIISTGYGEGENRVTKAIQDALNSPLLKNRDIVSSKRFLFNLYYSQEAEHKVKMGEMSEITKFMTNFSKNVKVIWGRAVDNTLGDKVKITILAAGFDISLGGDVGMISFDDKKTKAGAGQNPVKTGVEDLKVRMEEEYGAEKIAERDRDIARSRYILLDAGQLDDDVLINFIEKHPTFRRGNDQTLREEWRALTSTNAEKANEQPAAGIQNGKKVIRFD